MRCDEFNERFHQILDRRLPLAGDPALVSHATACATCRQQLQAWDALDTVLSDEDRPAPPVDLAGRVMAEMAAPAPRSPWYLSSTAWVGTALALAAVLLVGLTVLVSPQEVASAPEKPQNKPDEQVNLPAQPVAIAQPISNAPEPPAELPSEPEQDSDLPYYSDWVEQLSQESRNSLYLNQAAWAEPVSATVRPFTTSFQTAIEYPVPRPIATTFTTAIHAVRTSSPQEPPLSPGPQSSLPEPTDQPQAFEMNQLSAMHLG